MHRRIRSRRNPNLSTAESVEERCLLSAITVTSDADTIADDGEVTLREAIQAANTNESVDGSAAGSADEIDVISFADGISSIVLTGGQFEISESVTISGPEVRVTLDADQGSRHFAVTAEQVDFTVENLQFINGFTEVDSGESGGAIRVEVPFNNGGSLTVVNSIFDSNEADSHGGAIHVGTNDDLDSQFRDLYTITFTDSVFSNNISGGSGGGVLVTGNTFTRIEGSTFSGNSARRQAGGIMVFDSEENSDSVARAEVIGSTFTNNEAFGDGAVDGNGGGFNYFGDGSVLVEDSVFTGNTTNFGGGIRLNSRNGETQIIRNSVVSGNHARFAGGGIAGDVLEVTNTIVENNTARTDAGGIFLQRYDSTPLNLILDDSVIRGNQSSQRGGGVSTALGATVTVTDSQIVGNQALVRGGGLDLAGTVRIVDTLVADNTVTSGTGGGIYAVPNANGSLEILRASVIGNESGDDGGGLYVSTTQGPAVVANSIFAHNSAEDGGGIYVSSGQGSVSIHSTTIARNHSDDAGGGLFVQQNVGAEVRIESSILAENTFGTQGLLNDLHSSFSAEIDISTSLISAVDTVESNSTAGTADENGNFIGTLTDPINAGLTYTGHIGDSHAVIGLLPTSPAIDSGSNSTNATLDIRGASREQGAQVDMGAFEGTPERYLEINSAAHAESESDANATTTIRVIGAGEAFSVDFATADQTALVGDDYEATAGTLEFDGTDGQEEGVSVLVLADDLVERDETLEVGFTFVGEPEDLLVPFEFTHLVHIEDQDVGVQLRDDELFVGAADGDDTVLVELVGTEYQLSVNGETELFDQSRVLGAFVRLGHGDNNVDLGALEVPAEILTGDGNDTVLGSISHDVISVGAGDDVVDANAGKDRVVGGSGNDTLNGDRGPDTIFGGAGDDLLTGRGSFDVIYGSAGRDTLNGGAGSDSLFGGLDADFIQGGASSDLASGGEGNDTLVGGSHLDSLFGQGGDDRIEGGMANDFLGGGTGDDTLMGFLGNDTIHGGDGNDLASGGEGRDSVRGDAGNDSLVGGADADFILGGDGNDSVVGGGDNDTLWGEAGDDSIRGGGGDDSLLGHDGNDTLRGEAGNDRAMGEAGDDVLVTGDGDDSAFGGEGNDFIKAEAGNDLVEADAGDDTIDGGLGDDMLSAGDGNDRVEGGEGRDILIGGHGRDTLRGNEGDDILVSSEIFTSIEFLSAEWSSTERSYEVRATNIRGGAQRTDDRLNRTSYLRRPSQPNSTIVEDVDAGDVLRGGDGMDYFFASKAEGEIDRVFKEAAELFARL